MKTLLLVAISLITSSYISTEDKDIWMHDFEAVKAKAKELNKPILMSFAGSDWCRPCVMLTKEVYEDDKFKSYAEENLVLLLLDFPRLKKNKLSDEQIRHNEAMASKYNTNGEFPLVVLVDAEGNVIAKTGYLKGGADSFINYLNSVL